jgi:hypothetical protein
VLEHANHGARGYLPSGRVALQVFALPLQHAGPYFGGGWVMFAWVLNVFESAQRHVGVDKVWITLHKPGPLVVSGHGNWAGAELLNGGVHLVCVALQDAREGVVRLLHLTHDN